MRVFKNIILLCFLFLLAWIIYCYITLPNLKGLGNKTRNPSISVLSNTNNMIGSLGDVYAGNINFKDVSRHLLNAVIVVEDKRFYNHYGIDIRGFFRALFFNLKERRYAQGASTITQQLSKLIFLESDKTLSRKLRELMISFYLESNFTKQEILTMYLNRVYLGSGLYGVKSASKRYFLKHPKKLSIAEASILAGLLKSPSKLSPLVNKQASIKRAKLVIKLLDKEKLITNKEKNIALTDLSIIENNISIGKVINSRYFIDWIYSQTPDETLRSKKDLIIKSTLDTNIQRIVNTSVKQEFKNIKKNLQVAIIVMDYNGEVKAIKGGKNWNESKFNRATQSKRQLGSVFKTYVYLTALNMGFSLTDKVVDTPLKRNGWKPKNFGNKYDGEISLLEAFAKSSNVVAVKISESIGREHIIRQIKKLGIISKIPDEPSMPLGVASLSLLEVVGSFGAICGNGSAVIPYGIKEIQLRNGKSYWTRSSPQRKKIINIETQKNIKKLLRAVVSQGTAKRLSNLKFDIIGKTGTTQNNRDAWFIGCSKNYIIGVWVGRDDDKSMQNVFGSTIPLDIFENIIKKI